MVERTIKRGEKAEIIRLNEAGDELRFRQEEGSVLRLFVLHIPPVDDDSAVTDTIHVEQDGGNCVTEIYALCFLHGKASAVLHTDVRHNVGKGRSLQTVKFVLDDESRGEFRGALKIVQDAQQTDARQTNRNLLLSGKATVRTQPQLEIYADDVKASHGATTGQLDESALFYMRQRCLSEEEGRKLLLRAFMSDIIDIIPYDSLREKSIQAVDSVI